MEELLFIQKYYHYLIAFIFLLIAMTFLSEFKKSLGIYSGINFITICFSIIVILYLGNRDVSIGFDTFRYEYNFSLYENSGSFFIRKDPFFDFISYLFANYLNFNLFLVFCSSVYVLGTFYGLKLIFGRDFYIPFLIFLIYPYFINMGINVIRSGLGGSLFLIGIGVYYKRNNFLKSFLWIGMSLLFHISMVIPLLFFLITKFFNNTKFIFIIWLCSIVLAILGINIIASFVSVIEGLTTRIGDYAVNNEGESSWINFLMFGFFPIIFGVYFVLSKKILDPYYKWLVNAYMLIHIPYIILINTQFASRIGYLAEFMMPLILAYPLIKTDSYKQPFFKVKFCVIIFLVFLVKGYKVLVI